MIVTPAGTTVAMGVTKTNETSTCVVGWLTSVAAETSDLAKSAAVMAPKAVISKERREVTAKPTGEKGREEAGGITNGGGYAIEEGEGGTGADSGGDGNGDGDGEIAGTGGSSAGGTAGGADENALIDTVSRQPSSQAPPSTPAPLSISARHAK